MMQVLVTLQLQEFTPEDLDTDVFQIVLLSNTTENFTALEAQANLYKNYTFGFLNVSKHEEFAKNTSLNFPCITIHSALGILVVQDPNSIPVVLNYTEVKPDYEIAYFASDEEDMLLTAEALDNNVIFFYASKSCKTCEYVLAQVLQIAVYLKKKVVLVQCDGTRQLQLACSRQAVRSFPWIATLKDGYLYPLNKKPDTDVIAVYEQEIESGKFTQPGEPFSRQYFIDHKTKYGPDGTPMEFPIKPYVNQLEEKIVDLEKRLEKLLK